MNRYCKASKREIHRETEARIAHIIQTSESFLVCSHVNPDGDAVGSMVALGLFLKELGKDVYLYLTDPVPKIYHFLKGTELIQNALPSGRGFEVSILLDCSTAKRVGDEFHRYEGKGQVVVLDHHPPLEPMEAISLVDWEASATGELLYRIMEMLDIMPSPDVATALYLAISSDTGSFRFSNTSPRTLSVAAALLEAGADHRLLNERLYESYPPERFFLLAKVLQSLRLTLGGKMAVMEFTRDMSREIGGNEELTEGFVEIPRSIEGVEVAVFMREIDRNVYRVSLRSRGRVDVGQLAFSFKGGGHNNAAGCTLHGSREKVLGILEEEVRRRL